MTTTKWAVVWIKCIGEAHRNPYIDHCSVCMPYWEEYPVCPRCLFKVKDSPGGYFCQYCRKHLNKSVEKGDAMKFIKYIVTAKKANQVSSMKFSLDGTKNRIEHETDITYYFDMLNKELKDEPKWEVVDIIPLTPVT